ncbi:hypothetical protein QAD02_016898 [Eretmocerus hayati]|uniref:Uncharacterized protein n=1 Tax=Eretmocerus hayati TaxID=131215 RepID=A0ACC2PCC6_9HYME|nr:hypothetical protein QAD02_016898 [Eretmocerus hayati]
MRDRLRFLVLTIFTGIFVRCAPEFNREEFDAELLDLENDFLKDLEELRREELEDIEKFRQEVSSEEFAALPEAYLIPKLKQYDITQETPKAKPDTDENQDQDVEQVTEEDQISYEVLLSAWRDGRIPDKVTEHPDDEGETDTPEKIQESDEARDDNTGREVDDDEIIEQNRESNGFTDNDRK